MEDFETLSENLARVTNECERLREENSRLRELLNQQTTRSMESLVVAEQGRSEPTQASPEAIPSRPESATPELSVAGKIALFRSLFRGRDDVYAVRWESENGKSGYSLASIKDWDALRQVKAKCVLGLPATPVRKDGHHPIIYMQCVHSIQPAGPRTDGVESVRAPRETSDHNRDMDA